jgi:hypothetical protein
MYSLSHDIDKRGSPLPDRTVRLSGLTLRLWRATGSSPVRAESGRNTPATRQLCLHGTHAARRSVSNLIQSGEIGGYISLWAAVSHLSFTLVLARNRFLSYRHKPFHTNEYILPERASGWKNASSLVAGR